MKTWWIVVRHSPDYVDESGKVWPYPPEGFAISAFDEEEQARAFAVNSTTSKDIYEAIPVVRAAGA